MCLLVENTVNYTYSWFTGVRTGEAWQHPGCLIALCAANLIVGAAVAHSCTAGTRSVLCSRCRRW